MSDSQKKFQEVQLSLSCGSYLEVNNMNNHVFLTSLLLGNFMLTKQPYAQILITV